MILNINGKELTVEEVISQYVEPWKIEDQERKERDKQRDIYKLADLIFRGRKACKIRDRLRDLHLSRTHRRKLTRKYERYSEGVQIE